MTRTPLLLCSPERVACMLAQVLAGRNKLQTAKGNVAFHCSSAFHLHREFLWLEVKLHSRHC